MVFLKLKIFQLHKYFSAFMLYESVLYIRQAYKKA